MTFDHYTLRPIRMEDAKAFFTLVSANREYIRDYLPVTAAGIQDIPATEAYIEEKIILADEKEHYCLLIEDRHTHTLAGAFFLKNLDWKVPKCELGYFVNHAHGGKGLMSDAMARVVQFCFGVLGMNKIYLRTGIHNTASRRVAEKNGFEVEGILRRDFRIHDGSLVDLAYYGLVNPTLIEPT